ncbi:MAG: hypothetical protein DDG60_04160 [Anaerolineae bacterium]|nr:MAG: hypothetical protein DDG60_04160 [Anaerolineae bacterium]
MHRLYNETDRVFAEMTATLPFPFPLPSAQTPPGLLARAQELRACLNDIAPDTLAARTETDYRQTAPGCGEFHFHLFAQPILGVFPNLTFFTLSGDKLPDFLQVLLLYYFFTADGTPLSGQWVSFADLPDGRTYYRAFQAYSGDVLGNMLSNDVQRFTLACQALGGQPLEIGSAAFRFAALPRVPLLLTFWLGDEDFPCSCKVLFDSSATHYLPIDGCAILGSQLTSRLVKVLRSERSEIKSKDGGL